MSSPMKGFEPKNVTFGDKSCLFLHVLCISVVFIVTCYEPDGPWFKIRWGKIFCIHPGWS